MIDKTKLKYLEEELRKIWDSDDFAIGIINNIDYPEELDEMIAFVEENKGKNIKPWKYTEAFFDIEYGKDVWRTFNIVEDDEVDE